MQKAKRVSEQIYTPALRKSIAIFLFGTESALCTRICKYRLHANIF